MPADTVETKNAHGRFSLKPFSHIVERKSIVRRLFLCIDFSLPIYEENFRLYGTWPGRCRTSCIDLTHGVGNAVVVNRWNPTLRRERPHDIRARVRGIFKTIVLIANFKL